MPVADWSRVDSKTDSDYDDELRKSAPGTNWIYGRWSPFIPAQAGFGGF